MTEVQQQVYSGKSLLSGISAPCLVDSQDGLHSPLFRISCVTWLNFLAAYMVITFHVPTFRVPLVERLTVSWIASGLLRLSPFCFVRPPRRFVDVDSVVSPLCCCQLVNLVGCHRGPSSAKARIFWFPLVDLSIAIIFMGRGLRSLAFFRHPSRSKRP